MGAGALLIDCVAIVPSLTGFFWVIEEGSAFAAEGASGKEFPLTESVEDFCASVTGRAWFKRLSRD